MSSDLQRVTKELFLVLKSSHYLSWKEIEKRGRSEAKLYSFKWVESIDFFFISILLRPSSFRATFACFHMQKISINYVVFPERLKISIFVNWQLWEKLSSENHFNFQIFKHGSSCNSQTLWKIAQNNENLNQRGPIFFFGIWSCGLEKWENSSIICSEFFGLLAMLSFIHQQLNRVFALSN